MNVTVITKEPMDFGWGEDTRIEFTDAKYHVEKDEEGGRLHVQAQGQDGNVASFQRGEWRCVIKGDIVENPAAADGAQDGVVAPLTRVSGGDRR